MHTRPLNAEDIPKLATLSQRSFAQDALHQYIYPKQNANPASYRAYNIQRLTKRFLAPHLRGFVVVTDEKDEEFKQSGGVERLAGFAWFEEEDAGPEEDVGFWKRLERQLNSIAGIYHTWTNPALRSSRAGQFMREALAVHPDFSSLGRRFYVAMVAVDPDFQRRGVGGMLIGEGKKLAKESNVPIYLESSLAGRGLYKKCGFETVWEGEVCGIQDCTMVWKPT